ncbi:hypothetical protein NDN08_006191 [Rhodosorus marinus]|uniref:Uncharacterized protein n=1 Tax=Rhodosorus marinus TaxID=101924 RepID=A0AAV8UK41_9RHOD|nr:hypothetical protein NDN08_006191 [Rhodosorus marinus]
MGRVVFVILLCLVVGCVGYSPVQRWLDDAKRDFRILSSPLSLKSSLSALHRLRGLGKGQSAKFELDIEQEGVVVSRQESLQDGGDGDECLGTLDSDGNCVCGRFQLGERCSRSARGRCRIYVLEPSQESSCSGISAIVSYNSFLDGDPPCTFVKPTETFNFVFKLDCFLFDPIVRLPNGAIDEESGRLSTTFPIDEMDLQYEFRAINWKKPFSDQRSLSVRKLSFGETNNQTEIAVAKSLDLLNSWDDGYSTGGRFYFEGTVKHNQDDAPVSMSQVCAGCTARVFLDVEGYEYVPQSEDANTVTTVIVVVAVVGILLIGLIVLAVFWFRRSRVGIKLD